MKAVSDPPVQAPDGVVDAFTIGIPPGKYQAVFGGFVQNRASVASGAVAFEVQAAKSADRVPAKEKQKFLDIQTQLLRIEKQAIDRQKQFLDLYNVEQLPRGYPLGYRQALARYVLMEREVAGLAAPMFAEARKQ